MNAAPRRRKDPLTFDRWDRWGLTALLGLAAVVTVLGGVVGPVRDWVAGAPVRVEAHAPVSVPRLDAAGVQHGLATFDIEVPAVGGGLRLLSLLPGVLVALLVVVGGWLVLRIMRTVAAGEPFAAVNVTRMRALAMVLVLGSAVVFFLELSVRGALLGSAELGGLEPGVVLDVPWLPMLSGLVLAMLAEAFRTGSRLRDDVEGLV
ncbi:DUF2975 domain-containing protein [Phycicoccus avicenniae]|uniref:DUF2975 domain-containing protein n=1 Tax=Phycicoccus avicenniae TaxID=2828860 RepID=UPI003D270520